MAVFVVANRHIDSEAFNIVDIEVLAHETVLIPVDNVNKGFVILIVTKNNNFDVKFTVNTQPSLIIFGSNYCRQDSYNNRNFESKNLKKCDFVMGDKSQNNISKNILTLKVLVASLKLQLQQLLFRNIVVYFYLFINNNSQIATIKEVFFAVLKYQHKPKDVLNFITKVYVEIEKFSEKQPKLFIDCSNVKNILFKQMLRAIIQLYQFSKYSQYISHAYI